MKYKKTIIASIILIVLTILMLTFRVQAHYEVENLKPIDNQNKTIIINYYPDSYIIQLIEDAFISAGWNFRALNYEESNQNPPIADSKYIVVISENIASFRQDYFSAYVTLMIIERASNEIIFTFDADYKYNYSPLFPLNPNYEVIFETLKAKLIELNSFSRK